MHPDEYQEMMDWDDEQKSYHVNKIKRPTRIVDINGDIICEPEHYHESLKWGREMVDKMEADNVDRSDMLVIVNRLAEEIRFSLVMLKGRQGVDK